jgi:hypothetical protein
MLGETTLSIAMLAGFIWAVRFLLPRAIQERDVMAITCALLTAVLALLVWLLVGVSIRSGQLEMSLATTSSAARRD